MKILQVCDRPGWAVDRLSKPLANFYDNIDIVYVNASSKRFLHTGYTKLDEAECYEPEKCQDYDLIHFHTPVVTYLKNFDKLNPKTKKIITIHNEYCFDEKVMKEKEKEIINWSLFDEIVCSTKYSYNEMKKRHKKVHFVPLGINLKKYKYQPDEKPEERVIGYVGRIMEHKRFDVLTDACKMVGLKIAGCGYIDSGMFWNKAIAKLSPRDYRFYEFLAEPQMESFYRMMNLLVCLSKPFIEVGPLPVMEAMACGVPVISTKVGWAKDHCTEGENIFWITDNEASNPKLLGPVIKEIYDDKKLMDGVRKGALELIKDFSIEEYMRKLIKIYEKVS